jgi:ABC-type polysaccharide/polyol phosphate export permease
MFVALFLSSTLSVFEKNSKAQFRNFITPTKPRLFVFALFFTGFIILVVQAMIILFAADYFLDVHAFTNTLPVVLIVVSFIIFFISTGMFIGRFFSTHEGAVMASIILSSIFLFASNLVVPLESLAPSLSNVIKYNPYIISSELLRKALLFDLTIRDALPKISVLLGLTVIFLIIILISNSRHKKKYIPSVQKSTIPEKEPFQSTGFGADHSKHDAVFDFRGKKASNKEELLDLVSSMTRAEYEDNVNSHENKIVDWVFEGLKDKKLASQLRKASSREELIRMLAADVKKDEPEPEEKDEQEE